MKPKNATAKTSTARQTKATATKSKPARKTTAKSAKAAPTKKTTTTTPIVVHLDEGELLTRRIAELMFTKKAYDVTIIDVRGLTDITDYFVLCSADSDKQVKAISDAVRDGLLLDDERPIYVDDKEMTWIVLDYVNVIVHIFTKERREFYGLEKLWGDAKITRVKDEAELRLAPPKKTRKVKT
ncbi:MAG: ribosome silencing factor [Chloroherpetonaceae bacterium]|nr:ribosome silencing factor [Chloroherpetonaceae bacterium]MDW8437189.1 ribosome silencing factor [Chloroherpetonaceae bacterium]